ncbi:hypothetical protein GCM10009613_65870 [Pseudonocardia kongjuensis]|uniref:Recombinase zinc beta ribbon domain-containing protein n=1 Tax=Pseudonocardia kongjuensis TaxID=102227 RepID=A0ABN1YCH5_9PSEU
MGFLSSTAKGGARAGRAVAREVAAARHDRRGVSTERPDGRVYCRACGRRVRSGFGEVCSRAACHRTFMIRQGM